MKKNKIIHKKNLPLRTCIVTRVKKPKSELIRIVKTKGDVVKVDSTGKERGRGASIDMQYELLDKALNKRILQRALRLQRNLSENEIKNLHVDFKNVIELRNFRQGKKKVKIRVKKEELERINK